MSRAITCINCGIDGELKARGKKDDLSPKEFNYLGKNPLSGHRHYQCPSCQIVLLVDPAKIRAKEPIFLRKPNRLSDPVRTVMPAMSKISLDSLHFIFNGTSQPSKRVNAP